MNDGEKHFCGGNCACAKKKQDELLTNTLLYFDKTVEYLNLPSGLVDWLKIPSKQIIVPVPIKSDSKETKVFLGYRVQHKNVLGPFKGGIRFSPEVTLEMITALAMDMTWKCSVHGLPLGGGKGGVCLDTKKLSDSEICRATKRFTREIANHIGPKKDIPAPDMYTNPQTMLHILDAYIMHTRQDDIGVVTGKPVNRGGILGRNVATGMGCYYLMKSTAGRLSMDRREKVIIDGCGNAAIPPMTELSKEGRKIVGVSDSRGAVYNPRGLDINLLLKTKKELGSVIYYKEADILTESKEILELDCDILILAAKEGRVTAANADKIKAGYLYEPANGPTTLEAHEILLDRGIYAWPDILASGGGVTVSWYEMCQNAQLYPWPLELVMERLQENMEKANERMMETARKYDLGIDFRTAAHILAIEEVATAAQERGFWP